MRRPVEILGIYLHLARASGQSNQPHVRDRFLVICASMAHRLKLHTVAASCRAKVLDHNPNHGIGRCENMEEAMDSIDFLSLLKQIQRRYPLEKAETMLDNLGIELANERDAYFSDEEYAAALLGESLDSLNERFG